MVAPAGAQTPWRPPVGPPVAWPTSFGTRFSVFVDTEEEFDWSQPLSRNARAVTATAAIPAAHRWFADRGIALTFLVDHPVASDPAAVDRIRATFADGRSTVGTQLHPWVNPPHEEEVTGPNSFVGNLPLALQAAKLDILTDLITEQFGRRPLIYRAGRYGIGPETWHLLAERGYRIDSSLRARYDYRAESGPDFRHVGNEAFAISDGLIELPLTTVFTGAMRSPSLYEALGEDTARSRRSLAPRYPAAHRAYARGHAAGRSAGGDPGRARRGRPAAQPRLPLAVAGSRPYALRTWRGRP